jgi:hypothetical protein
MAVARIPLSGSTHGRGIKVVATATAGTTIHTAQATTTDGLGDEVHLWAYNDDAVNIVLTVEYGGATDPDDTIVTDVPPQSGLLYVVPGLWIRNSLVVRAFAGTANKITIHGFVNRVS